MALPRSAPVDALRPTADQALEAWAARVRADHEQVERCREVADSTDFYAPVADRFRHDPRRTDDAVLDLLLQEARPTDTWLDIGAGGGRYALPLALATREVVCVDPSTGMLDVLLDGMREGRVQNIRIVQGRWPLPPAETATDPATNPGSEPSRDLTSDVSLMAHVGYDIEAIGPFLDAMEAATSRRCVAVMGESAMTTIATLLWKPIHGEPRVALPALPELLALLVARGRLPETRLVTRVPPTFASYDDLLMMARRQLWLRPGSAKDERMDGLLRDLASETDGRWSVDQGRSAIGVVSWEPHRA